ncbi:MAG: hypothetical protein AUJ31_00500 [Parcubacteria group bacterium CG1_02_39_15]|uniref:Histone deacetylase domain-containing protein n=4 Tax=Candidatus Nealsoniibacteriota TaxID=1817911 RepID=A0A2G9YS40_9BACT|nr:MAG: hypothetical protein AUJ31_00500 [Parcubacteria group bacterium CG1_02_39_15]PIP22057.1 MAG: hypothetical protein COX38_02770 [Candidatus Nealsonbacteria bacterium CG23_combo_of_CG06-09_8_20_14_all_39_25]PIQ98418.1 MAG: hypothetical protein COV64_01390 [Candidatus Nealsonbacteria bacterium CG11_big_fil_rev_8_21_14_0_20_39_9]PIW90469.1 MAG: hypothetical protein COZ92_00645 [Candidatus Nealsonbacteria bacterium CG_4_8_14_3_um_filter_40_11]PIZ88224.1 MAG: hypothetical protein COX91_01330 [
MKRTGIFFPYMEGERLKDFPNPALEGILEKENVFYHDTRYEVMDGAYYLKKMPEELLAEVHTKEMIERVKKLEAFDGVIWSASGTVQASEMIFEGKIDNAFVFTGYGDHHAGKDFYGGGCYFNSAALAIANARRKYGIKRFAIVDTDPHHGDGTWDLFKEDQDVLYICFCVRANETNRNNKIDVSIPWKLSSKEYLMIVESELSTIRDHQPELIFWNFGYDGTQDEYGDIGISKGCHQKLAKRFKKVADEVCRGRLITVLCGGHQRKIATYVIPRIIRCLADIE